MKIMVVMGEYPAEEGERRRQAVLKCASPGTEIGFAVIKATFFRRSNSQVNSLSAGPFVAEVAVKAEADGYDAVVPFGTSTPASSCRAIWCEFPSSAPANRFCIWARN